MRAVAERLAIYRTLCAYQLNHHIFFSPEILKVLALPLLVHDGEPSGRHGILCTLVPASGMGKSTQKQGQLSTSVGLAAVCELNRDGVG